VSEPSWVGQIENDSDREFPQSQEYSLTIPERLQIQCWRGGQVMMGIDYPNEHEPRYVLKSPVFRSNPGLEVSYRSGKQSSGLSHKNLQVQRFNLSSYQ
jgi:hypothetical protein